MKWLMNLRLNSKKFLKKRLEYQEKCISYLQKELQDARKEDYSEFECVLSHKAKNKLLLDITKDKKGKYVFGVLENDILYLYDKKKSVCSGNHIGTLSFFRRKNRSYYICDIQLSTRNLGHGSILMRSLEKLIEFEKLVMMSNQSIYDDYKISLKGTLSWVDEKTEEDKARRNGFYQKHGFIISEGEIKKEI